VILKQILVQVSYGIVAAPTWSESIGAFQEYGVVDAPYRNYGKDLRL
jgi:hypothetical protein